jgi:hypothetical protein
VNGLEYIKGMLKVMIRILVTIDVSHVKEQISDLINGNGNCVRKALEAEKGLEDDD